mgnify:FL=1
MTNKMNTQNYPTWLVPLEIAKELKEIGFRNENCLFKFDRFSGLIFFNEKVDKTLDNSYVIISIEEFMKEMTIEEINNYHFHLDFGLLTDIPTWEQVFEWFREKGFESYIRLESHAHFDEGNYYYFEITKSNLRQLDWQGDFDDYNEAREALLNKLIELYKKLNNK